MLKQHVNPKELGPLAGNDKYVSVYVYTNKMANMYSSRIVFRFTILFKPLSIKHLHSAPYIQ